jgi:hypothetical protein
MPGLGDTDQGACRRRSDTVRTDVDGQRGDRAGVIAQESVLPNSVQNIHAHVAGYQLIADVFLRRLTT